MATSPQSGRTGKVLGLIAVLTMIMGTLVGIGFAPAASAAAPDVCPSGYTYNSDTKLCDGTESAASVVSGTPSGYECPTGWTLDGTKCTKAVEATKKYSCPSGWTLDGTKCTKSGAWEFEDGEWECEDSDLADVPGTRENPPATPCVKTKKADFDWYCETAVVTSSPIGYHSGNEKDSETHHREQVRWESGEEQCGGHNDDVKPTCKSLEIPATPVYPYVCPTGYSTTASPITSATECSKPVTTTPTCPAGQTLVQGDCQTPAEPVNPQNPAEPVQPQVSEPVVASAVVEAPAPAPAQQVVSAPAAATVAKPAKAPALTAVPQAATVPSAVPAGDGSSQQFPLWLAGLAVLVALTAAGAGFRLMGARD